MPDAMDMDLVREFARTNSEAAFAELVRRHINLVYSVARRCTGMDGDAQDVTQAVFIILARKAAGLRKNTLLAGWLYETTRFTAARLLRTTTRRHAREQEAYMQSTLNDADTDAVWEKLSPHLEAAMSRLAERDRALLVLRFFEKKTAPEAAALLGIREAAAHKRLSRALEKLRKVFAQRGVTLTATAIAGAVSTNSVQAAPVALVKTATAVAIANGSFATASTLTLVKGTINFMAWLKTKTAMVIGAGTLLAGAAALTLHEQREQNREQEQKIRAQEQQIRAQVQQPGLSAEERQKLERRLKQLRAEQGQLRAAQDRLRQQEADLFREPSARISPFTNVRFDGEKVLVTYSGVEYQLAAINDLTTPELIGFCRRQYKDSWQKRLAEDLVVVLREMKHPVNAEQTVGLTLIETNTGAKRDIEHAAMTVENRQAVHNALVLDQK